MRKFKAWLPALVWMGVIFAMSAATGETSSEQSGFIVRLLTAVYGAITGGAQLSQEIFDALGFLVRKAAHMGEYAVLAVLYARALRLTGANRPYVLALLLCVIYAASDEIHQAFVPGRGPSPVDVMIDTAGACIGLAFSGLCIRRQAKAPSSTFGN